MLAQLGPPAVADDDVPLIDVIVVEGSRLDRYLPSRTDVDREEIVESHRSDLPEVLDLTPGINVRVGGRGEPRLDMRGFDQRAVLFTLDGVPVYEPYNGIVNLNLFPIEMLGGIEITRGPSSALYGPNGMAGTVRLDTLVPRAPLSADATALWRDSKFWDVRASGGVERGGLSVVAAGRYLTSDGFWLSDDFLDRKPTRRRFEDGGLRTNSDREQASGFASAGYRLPNGRVHASFLGSNAEFGIPPSTTGFIPRYRRNTAENLLHAQTGIEHRLTDRIGGSAAVFYSRYLTKEKEYDGPDLENAFYHSRAESNEIGLIGRLDIDVAERDSLSVGGQVRWDRADLFDSANGSGGEPDFTTGSTAVENLFFATERLTLITGLSLDIQGGDESGTDWEVNPHGGASFDLEPWGVVRAAVARKIRFPTLRERFDPLQGNPDLDPEKTLTFEVGYRIARSIASLEASLFRSQVNDLIEVSGGSDPQVAMNLEDAVLQGVELAAGVAPFGWVALDLNYTYLDTSASNPSGTEDSSEVQHRPPHRFNGILRFFLPKEFLLRLEGLYTSEQVDRFGSRVRLDDFGLFNVRLSRRIGPWVELFGGVDNLLDADSEEKLGTPQAGRRGYAGIRGTY